MVFIEADDSLGPCLEFACPFDRAVIGVQ